MKSYEDTKDANERAPSPELSPEYPEEVGFGPKLKFYLCLSKLFVYLILLPIVGLYSKTSLKLPLKDIRKGC